MKIEERSISVSRDLGRLLAIDARIDGVWVGLFRTDDRLRIHGTHCDFPCSVEPRYPLIRAIETECVLLVDTRIGNAGDNAWLFDSSGNRRVAFCAGDGVEDVLGSEAHLVFTYFDEGIFSGMKPSDEGVAVFDPNGRLQLGYLSFFGSQAADVVDCYAACRGRGADEIWFSPYTEFPLVGLNLREKTQVIHSLPKKLEGARALTTMGDGFLFHGPYADEQGFYFWRPGDRKATKIGTRAGRGLRGIADGCFLEPAEDGYTLVRCIAT